MIASFLRTHRRQLAGLGYCKRCDTLVSILGLAVFVFMASVGSLSSLGLAEERRDSARHIIPYGSLHPLVVQSIAQHLIAGHEASVAKAEEVSGVDSRSVRVLQVDKKRDEGIRQYDVDQLFNSVAGPFRNTIDTIGKKQLIEVYLSNVPPSPVENAALYKMLSSVFGANSSHNWNDADFAAYATPAAIAAIQAQTLGKKWDLVFNHVSVDLKPDSALHELPLEKWVASLDIGVIKPQQSQDISASMLSGHITTVADLTKHLNWTTPSANDILDIHPQFAPVEAQAVADIIPTMLRLGPNFALPTLLSSDGIFLQSHESTLRSQAERLPELQRNTLFNEFETSMAAILHEQHADLTARLDRHSDRTVTNSDDDQYLRRLHHSLSLLSGYIYRLASANFPTSVPVDELSALTTRVREASDAIVSKLHQPANSDSGENSLLPRLDYTREQPEDNRDPRGAIYRIHPIHRFLEAIALHKNNDGPLETLPMIKLSPRSLAFSQISQQLRDQVTRLAALEAEVARFEE